jgi:hypothetical protein
MSEFGHNTYASELQMPKISQQWAQSNSSGRYGVDRQMRGIFCVATPTKKWWPPWAPHLLLILSLLLLKSLVQATPVVRGLKYSSSNYIVVRIRHSTGKVRGKKQLWHLSAMWDQNMGVTFDKDLHRYNGSRSCDIPLCYFCGQVHPGWDPYVQPCMPGDRAIVGGRASPLPHFSAVMPTRNWTGKGCCWSQENILSV